jgi:hypothetical protein
VKNETVSLSEYEKQVLSEIKADFIHEDEISKRIKYVSFLSRSKGKNNRGIRTFRRHPVEVEMIVVDNSFALPIKRGEIKINSRHCWASKPDCLAEEILGSGATSDQLLKEVRTRANWKNRK